jgi:dihydrofolate reductase
MSSRRSGGRTVQTTKEAEMSKVKVSMAVSLDGYVAGPNQTLEEPLGEGGEQLHEWMFDLEIFNRIHGRQGGEVNESTPIVEEFIENVGAFVMGRNMFGGGPGEWDESWRGWWGDEPPYHAPVFVLTHHAREPLPMEGGTTFYFVTDGIESALEQARAAAGGRDVLIAGGASAVQQYLAAGLIDRLTLSIAPVLLGGGTRFFAEGAAAELEPVGAVEAPGVTHLRYRVRR